MSSENFKQWLLGIGKSERTAGNYAGAIGSTLSKLASEQGFTESSLYQIQEPKQLYRVSEKIQQLPEFKEKNIRGNGMYSAALNQYLEFLHDFTSLQLSEDIEQIIADDGVSTTDKVTLVNTRLGQGRFRSRLIEQWQGCAVTGYRDVRFLVASHIKPWHVSSNEERLNPYNGLLLLPNLDKVFDLGYITFTDRGKMAISEQLEEYSVLGVSADMRIELADQHQEYMAYHRDNQFRK